MSRPATGRREVGDPDRHPEDRRLVVHGRGGEHDALPDHEPQEDEDRGRHIRPDGALPAGAETLGQESDHHVGAAPTGGDRTEQREPDESEPGQLVRPREGVIEDVSSQDTRTDQDNQGRHEAANHPVHDRTDGAVEENIYRALTRYPKGRACRCPITTRGVPSPTRRARHPFFLPSVPSCLSCASCGYSHLRRSALSFPCASCGFPSVSALVSTSPDTSPSWPRHPSGAPAGQAWSTARPPCRTPAGWPCRRQAHPA